MTYPLNPLTGDARHEDLMTVTEAARFLGQPVEDVFRSVICDRLPVVWVGPRPYVDRSALSREPRAGQEHAP